VDKKKLFLCVPPTVWCLVDQTITLVGQSPVYWKGDYSVANEVNPLYCWLLKQHPLAFEAGIAAWILLFCCAIYFLPRRISMTISVAIVLGHSWGTSTWLSFKFSYGYWIILGLFFLSGVILVWSWDTFFRMQQKELQNIPLNVTCHDNSFVHKPGSS